MRSFTSVSARLGKSQIRIQERDRCSQKSSWVFFRHEVSGFYFCTGELMAPSLSNTLSGSPVAAGNPNFDQTNRSGALYSRTSRLVGKIEPPVYGSSGTVILAHCVNARGVTYLLSIAFQAIAS